MKLVFNMKWFQSLTRRAVSDKILRCKAFLPKYPTYDGLHRVFASIIYKFVDKKASGGASKNKLCLIKS